jgi:hypothetical protein
MHSNAITLTYSNYTGSLQFDGAVPIIGATGKNNIPDLTLLPLAEFFRAFRQHYCLSAVWGGDLRGQVVGTEGHLYRSGLLDSFYRFSVNLKGGPAMSLDQFLAENVDWSQPEDRNADRAV